MNVFQQLIVIALIACGSHVGYCQTSELKTDVSIVDYLKSQGLPSNRQYRKSLYECRFVNDSYSGISEQNLRLLLRLVSEHKGAKKLAQESLRNTIDAAKEERASKASVSDNFACPGWVPAMGFGVNGSYGFSTRIHPHNGLLIDRNFVVLVHSAAASLGKLQVRGKVRLFIEGNKKPFAEFPLQSAWFDTIGSSHTVSKYGKKGMKVRLPEGKNIFAEITLLPTVKTVKGSVALWSCTRRIVLDCK